MAERIKSWKTGTCFFAPAQKSGRKIDISIEKKYKWMANRSTNISINRAEKADFHLQRRAARDYNISIKEDNNQTEIQ